MSGESPPNLSAQESLELIDRESAVVAKRLQGGSEHIGAMWAVLWFVAFLTFHLAGQGWPGPLFPLWVPGVVMTVLVGLGSVVSAVIGIRSGKGVKGTSSRAGAMYGISWPLGFAALITVNLLLTAKGLPVELIGPLWAGSTMGLTGALCLAGGAMFRDTTFYGTGVVFLVTAVVAVLVGMDYQAAVMAFGGLLGFGVPALVQRRRGR
ncbi:hypothetical protein [Amycolatopsis magusensis]|uniref:Uncharacterized protein n=1 Tax=Amycolatopsis magusensis TaxID=882444 RepID=A0ABS4PRE1_9PSEU|nr:hypothetical protein [Amycolatopsis magusensis]MBP2181418.1 hypothetical protein [Amycolatopsis magusensis]